LQIVCVVPCLVLAVGAVPLSVSTDTLTPNDLTPLSNPIPAIGEKATAAVGSLINQVMASLQPLMQRKLDDGMAAASASSAGKSFIDLDVSPTFEISMLTDMAGGFHDNNGATSEEGRVTRTNGVQVDANFSNSLHDNNNAVGNGNVSRINGLVSESEPENSAATIKAAVETASSLGRLVPRTGTETKAQAEAPAAQMASIPWQHDATTAQIPGAPMHAHSNPPLAAATAVKSVVKSAAHKEGVSGSFLTIKVDPTFKINVTTNMSGAFFNNNKAESTKGDVTRVNGGYVGADFSGALHNNNGAISNGTSGNSVERFNGWKK